MTLTVSITQDDLFKAIGDFLTSVLPVGVPVVKLPINRAAMPPPDPGYVGMRLMLHERIMTNLDKWDQTDPAPTEIAIEQAIKFTAQLDCYGPDSGDWAVILSTVLRDEYAVTAMAATPVTPLYAEAPRFAPLTNEEAQYEFRWIVSSIMQYNPVVSTPMQFANTAAAALINVDEAFPP